MGQISSFSRETFEDLLKICRSVNAPTDERRCIDETEDRLQELLLLAHRHRLHALFADKTLSEEKAVEANLAQLTSRRTKTYFLQISDLISLSRMFAAAKIPFIVLKGPSIAERYYQKPHLRHSNDIDLLIPDDRVSDALNVLLSSGNTQTRPSFRLADELIPMLKHKTSGFDVCLMDTKNVVEVHWRCVQNEEMLPWSYADVIEHTEKIDIAGKSILVMKPEYQLVYLACHGSKHGWFRLKWLYDICRIVENMSPEVQERAKSLATKAGTERMLAIALKLVEMFFKVQSVLDPKWVDDCCDQKAIDYCCQAICDRKGEEPGTARRVKNVLDYVLFASRLRASVRYKWSLVAQYLYSLEDIGTLRLSRRWLPLYWVTGPLLFVMRCLKPKHD